MTKPLVIAHRGASAYEVENSLAAFRAAARYGADGVELDVHASQDGELFVHHDEKADGVHIAHSAAEAVTGVRLANGEPIPTLSEALAAIAPPLRVYVEVKSLPPRWDTRLFETLDRGPNPQGYAVHGFDHRIIRRLGEQRPRLPRGVLVSAYPVHPLAGMQAAGATLLWQERPTVDQVLVAAVHGAGGRVIVWTVDDPAEMARLIGIGVDGICTNVPDVGRRVVDALPLPAR